MKRILSLFIFLLLTIPFCSFSKADDFDLSDMSIAELDNLINKIVAEKKVATSIDSRNENQLKEHFKKMIESYSPNGCTISYPFWGLSASRERSCYQIWGDCNATLSDKSKIKYEDAHALYWYNEDDLSYYCVAFYTKENVYYYSNDLVNNISRYLDSNIIVFLNDHMTESTITDQIDPFPKELSDEEKLASIKSEKDMGYDLAFWENVSVGRSWDYYLIDFDRAISTEVFILAHKGSEKRSVERITTHSIIGNLNSGWKTVDSKGNTEFYFNYTDNGVIRSNEKKELETGKVIKVSEAVSYLKSGLPQSASSALRLLTP